MNTSRQHTVWKEPLRLSRSLAKKFSLAMSRPASRARRSASWAIASEMSLALMEQAPIAASGRLRLPTPQPASQKLAWLSSPLSLIQASTSSTVFW